MSGRRKKFCSVSAALKQVSALELRCERAPLLYNLRKEELMRAYKALMSLCNSLALVFMQYDLVQQALSLLKKAGKADLEIHRQGSLLDRLWKGRVITYNILAYFFHKVGDYSAALKFVYDSQALLIAMQKAGLQTPCDVVLSTNFIAFHVLWRVGKFEEGKTYIQVCIRAINQLLRGELQSRLSHNDQLNLMGLVVMSLSAVQLTANSDYPGALETVSEGREQLEEFDVEVKPLMAKFCTDLESRAKAGVGNSQPLKLGSIPTEKLRRKPSSEDLLITSDYEVIFFTTTLLPFISAKAPLIHSAELEQAKRRQQKLYEEETRPTLLSSSPAQRLDTSVRPHSILWRKLTSTSPNDFSTVTRREMQVSPAFDTEQKREKELLSRSLQPPAQSDKLPKPRHDSVPPISTKTVLLSPSLDSGSTSLRTSAKVSEPPSAIFVFPPLSQSPVRRKSRKVKTYRFSLPT